METGWYDRKQSVYLFKYTIIQYQFFKNLNFLDSSSPTIRQTKKLRFLILLLTVFLNENYLISFAITLKICNLFPQMPFSSSQKRILTRTAIPPRSTKSMSMDYLVSKKCTNIISNQSLKKFHK